MKKDEIKLVLYNNLSKIKSNNMIKIILMYKFMNNSLNLKI
jgi:hypothetical protein